MRRKILALVLFMLIVTACNGEDPYPEEAVRNFITSCASEPGVTEENCQCIIDSLQEKLAYEEFRQFEEKLEQGSQSFEWPQEVLDSVDGCR